MCCLVLPFGRAAIDVSFCLAGSHFPMAHVKRTARAIDDSAPMDLAPDSGVPEAIAADLLAEQPPASNSLVSGSGASGDCDVSGGEGSANEVTVVGNDGNAGEVNAAGEDGGVGEVNAAVEDAVPGDARINGGDYEEENIDIENIVEELAVERRAPKGSISLRRVQSPTPSRSTVQR